MNKIVIGKDVISSLDDAIEISVCDTNKLLEVRQVKIKILKSTDLAIKCEGDIKYDIYVSVLDGARASIYEFKGDNSFKFQYKFYLGKMSYLRVEKVICADANLEMAVINLNGEGAKIDYFLKTICKNPSKYNFLVYHNAKKTVSNIVNNGVNILDGVLEFNVSSFADNGIKGCDINQSNRIINLNDNKCVIKPNLFIDENDVVANHSAFIGTFSFDDLFYLMSRGISKKEALNLLLRGFLLKDISYYKDAFEEVINKYWR